MKFINSKILLILVVVIAAFLRFYQLGTNPPSLTWDEVAWGYNAYSLGIDGRDEFGKFLPYDYLESFGDFKPPMYAYLSIIPVKLFGLTEFATRFASAFFGVLTVLLTYFLVKELLGKRKIKKDYDNDNSTLHATALLSSFILAISPWHFMLSRAAFEANIATFFLVLGVYFFVKGIRRNAWFIILSAVSFIASMYTFNTARIVAPLLVMVLAIGFWKELFQYKKQTIVAALVGIILLLPIVPFLLSDQAKLRFKEVNIFTELHVVETANQYVANDNNAWWSKIIHNRRVGYSIEFLRHYFDNLTPNFLFIKGDGNPKFSTQVVGQMYLWELPFLIAGILFLFRRRDGSWWIIPVWLLLAIIPAATARETPHALRIEATLPTFQILVAYGIVQSAMLLLKYQLLRIKLLYIIVIPISFFALMTFFYFIENYIVHYPKEFAGEWQYGYKDAIKYMNEVDKQYKTIYVTPTLGRPYAYALFYKKYDPTMFRNDSMVKREALGFVTVVRFDKYYFEKTAIPNQLRKNALYIDPPIDMPGNAKVKKKFYLPNGDVALVAYTLN